MMIYFIGILLVDRADFRNCNQLKHIGLYISIENMKILLKLIGNRSTSDPHIICDPLGSDKSVFLRTCRFITDMNCLKTRSVKTHFLISRKKSFMFDGKASKVNYITLRTCFALRNLWYK